MEQKQSVIEFLTEDEFELRSKTMINGIREEAKRLNRPIYYGENGNCIEEWSDGRKYLLIKEETNIISK